MTRLITQLPNTEAYDRWAATYDTDGNILQSLDTHGLSTILLPRLLRNLTLSYPPKNTSTPLQITDLGCGTGRATLCLLAFLQQTSNAGDLFNIDNSNNGQSRELHITGLDASKGMLEIAQKRVPESTTIKVTGAHKAPPDLTSYIAVPVKTAFRHYDILAPPPQPSPPLTTGPADAVICSLVIEHLPNLATFFQNLVGFSLPKPGGLLLLTNMHPDMARGASGGARASSVATTTSTTAAEDRLERATLNATGAGFTDVLTGKKIRVAESYAHSIGEMVDAATAAGFELMGGEEEMGVEQWMIERGIVDEGRGRKWVLGGVKCWVGVLFRLVGAVER